MKEFMNVGNYSLLVQSWPATNISRGSIQFLPGPGQSMADFEDLAAYLNDYGYNALGLEPPAGEAPGDGLTFWISAALTQAKSLEKRPVLFGHGWGAVAALRAAQVDPKAWAGLILSAPPRTLSLFVDLRQRLQRTTPSLKQRFESCQVLSVQGKELAKLPGDLPILLLAGTQDAEGGKGKSAMSLAKKLKDRGKTEVYLRFYEGADKDLHWSDQQAETRLDLLKFLRLTKRD